MKICGKCHIEKDESEFKPMLRKNGKIYISWCIECFKIYNTERRRKLGIPKRQMRKVESIPDYKTCSCCGIEKQGKEFRQRIDNLLIILMNSDTNVQESDTTEAK